MSTNGQSWQTLFDRYCNDDDEDVFTRGEKPYATVAFVDEHCIMKIADQLHARFRNNAAVAEMLYALIRVWKSVTQVWRSYIERYHDWSEKSDSESSDGIESCDCAGHGDDSSFGSTSRPSMPLDGTDEHILRMAIFAVCASNTYVRSRFVVNYEDSYGRICSDVINLDCTRHTGDAVGEIAFVRNAIKNVGYALALAYDSDTHKFCPSKFLLCREDLAHMTQRNQYIANADTSAAQRILDSYFANTLEAQSGADVDWAIEVREVDYNCDTSSESDDNDDDDDDDDDNDSAKSPIEMSVLTNVQKKCHVSRIFFLTLPSTRHNAFDDVSLNNCSDRRSGAYKRRGPVKGTQCWMPACTMI